MSRHMTRRDFLRSTAGLVGATTVGSLLAACSQQPPAAATQPPAKPTEAAKPAAAAAAAPTKAAQSGKKVVAKFGHIAAADQPHGLAAQKLADLAKQYSNGEIEIQVFPSSQIGAEPQLFQGVKSGAIEIALQGEGTLAQPVPKYHWSFAPFVLTGPEHYQKVLQSDVPKMLAEELLKATGVRAVEGWYRSARHMGHRAKPIRGPQDAKGEKLRVAEVPLYIDAYRDMGFAVTPMNWGELYGALQQGVVDMAEAQLEWFWGSKLFEVQKYLMLTAHCYGNYIVEVNDKWWLGLSQEHRDIIAKAAKEAGQFNEQEVKKWDSELAAKLAEQGMTVVKAEQIDLAAYRKVVLEKSIPRYEEKWGKGFYDQIMKLA